MHEASWNGLPGVRREDAPLGPETTRLVPRLRECGHARQDIIQWPEDLSAPRSYVKHNHRHPAPSN